MGSCCRDNEEATTGQTTTAAAPATGEGCCSGGDQGVAAKHADLVDRCALSPTQMALAAAGTAFAWYALPDYVRSRPLRVLAKTGMLIGVGATLFRHCDVSLTDLATGEASRLAKESLSEADGDVTCCGSPKQPAADKEPVGVTPDGRQLVDKLTDTKASGGECGCGRGGDEGDKAAEGCCQDEDAPGTESCPVVNLHERAKALFAGDLKRGWPILTMVGAGVAVNFLAERLIFAAGQARARRGATLPHTQHALAISLLLGLAEYHSSRISSCECVDECANGSAGDEK